MYELVIKTKFSAAHQLKHYRGECEQLHGHNWDVEVILTKPTTNAVGMVIDFKEANRLIEKIIKHLDHKYLNKLKLLENENPTTEHLARFIYKKLEKLFSSQGINVKKVGVWESPFCGAYYSPD